MPGLSSLVTSRHSSSRCGFAGGPSRRATSSPSTRCGHSWLSGRSPDRSTARASSLGLGPAPLQQPQPGPHPELPRGADRGVALLADPQGLGDRLLGLAEAALLDVVVAQVAHRRRRQVVEPVRAGRRRWRRAGRPGRRSVALEQPRHRDPDGRGAAQHRVVAQLARRSRGACCPDRRASAVSPRHAARKAWRARAKPERPRVVGGRRGSRWRPRRAARRARGRRRTRRSRRARCARRRPRRSLPARAAAPGPAPAPRSRPGAGR